VSKDLRQDSGKEQAYRLRCSSDRRRPASWRWELHSATQHPTGNPAVLYTLYSKYSCVSCVRCVYKRA